MELKGPKAMAQRVEESACKVDMQVKSLVRKIHWKYCLGKPMDRGDWGTTVHMITKELDVQQKQQEGY